MGFRTKLDYSNNRQIKQHIETLTVLSGATNFGVPFNTLPVGPNLLTTGETESYLTVASTFSGNSGTTNYTWFHPAMEYAISGLSALTPSISAITQTTIGFSGNSYTVIDGNTIALGYSGATFDLLPIAMYDLGGGNYSGTVYTQTLDILSATTLDFTGRTIWVDVSGITRTDELIIARNPVVGYVWTCFDSEGKGVWSPSSGSSATTTLWSAGTGAFSLVPKNHNAIASGNFAVAIGDASVASGDYSHAEGVLTIASGLTSHAEGGNTQAIGDASHAEGTSTIANGTSSHAEGTSTIANGTSSHAEGAFSIASGANSHAEGQTTTASGLRSHAEGLTTVASEDASHAEGSGTTASGRFSHAQGTGTISSGENSHAEGQFSVASGIGSHSQGDTTLASGDFSHCEGNGGQSIGFASHAQGNGTTASGDASHSEGTTTIAGGTSSHAGGTGAIASGASSFNHSTSSGGTSVVYARDSAILGGVNSQIVSAATNTVVLGGLGLTGFSANTVYVPSLNINSVGAGPGTVDIGVDANGTVVNQASDIRLKENITTIDGALAKVLGLRGVTYNWRDRDRGGDALKIGFIAQEVNSVVPELIFNSGTDEFMGVHYKDVSALLVEAIKELVTGNTIINNTILETQTIVAEDNNIELNFNGTEETAIGGGIRVNRGEDLPSELTLNENGDWVTNNNFKPKTLIIPTYTPSSSNDENGILDSITKDDNYLYIKTTNGWKRTNLENF
jgi:hypothetical protein